VSWIQFSLSCNAYGKLRRGLVLPNHEVLAAPGCKEIELVNSDQTIDFGFSERNSFSSAHILPERFFFLFGLSLRQSQEQSFSHDEVGWISHNAG